MTACESTTKRNQPFPAQSEINIENAGLRPEAASLLHAPLYAPELSPEIRAAREDDLEDARMALEAHPADENAIIWYGRRLAYLGRYSDALNTFTRGMQLHPGSVRLRRHSGHRLITLRRFDDAVTDLTRAAELATAIPDTVEPDGMPNAAGIPRSTTKSNIYYHLGLAHYLQGDFESALDAYRQGMKYSKNDDMLCATTHWLYMTLRRLGRDAEAQRALEPIHADMEILENHAYHALLMMYRNERTPKDTLAEAEQDTLNLATVGYGVGNWWWCEGQRDQAIAIWQRIINKTEWPAFGHIAAEAELARGR